MIAALILAAGYSSRMGDKHKALLPIGGASALERLILAFKAAGISNIAVVTGFNYHNLLPSIRASGAINIFNPDFNQGMFSSICAGINFFRFSASTGIIMAPVDCPLIPISVIRSIISAASSGDSRFIVPRFNNKKGHPLFIPQRFFDSILSHDGQYGIKGVTSKFPSQFSFIESSSPAILHDIDTHDDYLQLLHFHRTSILSMNLADRLRNRRLFLIRHGRIVSHSEKIFLGQYDPPLAHDAHSDILRALDDLFAFLPYTDRIYSSDLQRALQSAFALSRFFPHFHNIIPSHDLREINLGSWDGKPISFIASSFPHLYAARATDLTNFKPDTSFENFHDLQFRVLDFIDRLLLRDPLRDLIFLTHSGVIKVISAAFFSKPISWALNSISPLYGSIYSLLPSSSPNIF